MLAKGERTITRGRETLAILEGEKGGTEACYLLQAWEGGGLRFLKEGRLVGITWGYFQEWVEGNVKKKAGTTRKQIMNCKGTKIKVVETGSIKEPRGILYVAGERGTR